MTIAFRPVVKTWLDELGRPTSGTVRFELLATLGDTETQAIMPAPVFLPVAAGLMRFEECPVRDDPELTYEITPALLDGAGVSMLARPYYVRMPYGLDEITLPDKAYLSPAPHPWSEVPGVSVPSVVPLPVGAPLPDGLPDFSVIVRY